MPWPESQKVHDQTTNIECNWPEKTKQQPCCSQLSQRVVWRLLELQYKRLGRLFRAGRIHGIRSLEEDVKSRIVAVACLSALLLWTGRTANAAQFNWKTGRAFQRALAGEFAVVNWPEGRRFRDQLVQLSERQRVAIFLDRRIDPDQSVSFSARQITFLELLNRLAAKVGATTLDIGSVIYIGPRDQVAGLTRIAQQRVREARALSSRADRRWLAKRPCRWERLARPRRLLERLAEEVGVTIDGIDKVPHDLWPQTSLPPLRWIDRMTLVLAGFGLTYQFVDQGDGVRPVPLPSHDPVTRLYQATSFPVAWERVAKQFPAAGIEHASGKIRFRGTPEEHERLRQLLSGTLPVGKTQQRSTKTVHSLRVSQQPVGAILKTIQQQLGLRLKFAAGVRDRLSTRVTFELENVPLDQLLEATLTPASLTFHRDGELIHIESANSKSRDQSGTAQP